MTKQHNDYYTYAYLREDKTPYYIGKGRGRRIYRKNRTINAPTDKSRIIFLKKNLTEAEAFKHEIYMIFVFGRKDLGTGILRNRTNGGDGPSGAVRSGETRKKLSEANIGEKNPMFGVPRTEEERKKLSEAMSGRTGENHPLFGVPRTEEAKKKISEALSGRFMGALNHRSKAIIAIEPDGTERHFGSIREAARELKMAPNHLGRYSKYGHVLTQGPHTGWQFFCENPAGVL